MKPGTRILAVVIGLVILVWLFWPHPEPKVGPYVVVTDRWEPIEGTYVAQVQNIGDEEATEVIVVFEFPDTSIYTRIALLAPDSLVTKVIMWEPVTNFGVRTTWAEEE